MSPSSPKKQSMFTKILGSLSPKAPKTTRSFSMDEDDQDDHQLLDLRDISSSLLMPKPSSGRSLMAASFDTTEGSTRSSTSSTTETAATTLTISTTAMSPVIACRSHGDYCKSEVFEPATFETCVYETTNQNTPPLGETTKRDIDLMLL